MNTSVQSSDADKVQLRTLWAILLAIQILLLVAGALLTTLNVLSTPKVRPQFTVERSFSCAEEEKRQLREGKPTPETLKRCVFLERYVDVLEADQEQLLSWLKYGFVGLMGLSALFLIIELLIIRGYRHRS